MNRISVLIPTWGRPERLAEAVQSILQTQRMEPGATTIWVRVSTNDPRRWDYHYRAEFENRVVWVWDGESDSYPKGIELLRKVASGDIFFCGSDDSLFRTAGWDLLVDRVFREAGDAPLIAYANNGMGREKCEQFFASRSWVEAVGWLMRPEYEHFCCDQDVEEIANASGRLRFLREVVCEHMHKKYGKAPDDDTYRKVRGESGTNERDLATFARLAPERLEAIERLRGA